jgi:Putative adhesin
MMKTMAMRAIALSVAALAVPVLALASDGNFDKTLSVSGNVQLEVSTGSGYVHVTPGSDNQVHIIGHVHANRGWMGGNSDEQLKRVVDNPPIQQSGNTIRVGQTHENSWLNHVSIDYDITTPKSTHLKAESGSGDLKAISVNGGTRLETGSGTINGDDLGGDSFLETGSGDIRVNYSNGASVTASAGSGSIRLTGVKGGLKAETGSGDISIAGQPTQDWKVEAGSGSIDLNLGGAKFTLDAETGSGSIRTDQPISMQGSLEKHHVTGTVNGGGPTVKVETGSGSVRIH